MKYEQLNQIMQTCFKEVGIKNWVNKENVLFRLKSKYGDIFNREEAGSIYDNIYTQYLEGLDKDE